MVILQTCEICSNNNVQDNILLVHPIRYYFSCFYCKDLVKNLAEEEEIEKGIYKNYKIFGIKEINITRSSGSITSSYIKKKRDDFISFRNNNIYFPVEFSVKDIIYKKRIELIKVKNINFHLPIFQIVSSNNNIIKINKKLQEFCIINNEAIKLLFIGFRDKNSFFNKLPYDLFKNILFQYYIKIPNF